MSVHDTHALRGARIQEIKAARESVAKKLATLQTERRQAATFMAIAFFGGGGVVAYAHELGLKWLESGGVRHTAAVLVVIAVGMQCMELWSLSAKESKLNDEDRTLREELDRFLQHE